MQLKAGRACPAPALGALRGGTAMPEAPVCVPQKSLLQSSGWVRGLQSEIYPTMLF